jgi:uncharacterized membrane protein YfcA
MSFLSFISVPMVLSGFAVGFLVGMTGVGGGSLMTPLLILLFGIAPEKAVATDLIYASLTKSGGSIIHGLHKTIDWPLVGKLCLGSLPASLLTLTALHVIGFESSRINHIITQVLGFALIVTALAVIARPWLLTKYRARVGTLSPQATTRLTILTGAILGTLVTVSSVGAGALGVTALILLYPELPIARIAGSDIAHAVPLTLVAGVGHVLGAAINFDMLGSLLLGSLPGIVISSNFAPRLPDKFLRYVLAAVLLAVSIKLLFF